MIAEAGKFLVIINFQFVYLCLAYPSCGKLPRNIFSPDLLDEKEIKFTKRIKFNPNTEIFDQKKRHQPHIIVKALDRLLPSSKLDYNA